MVKLIGERGKFRYVPVRTHNISPSAPFLILLSIAFILIATSCVNHTPSVINLFADPSVIEPGDTCTLTCVASDPDGDNLTYTWMEDGAIIAGTGNTVTWTAPYHEGRFVVVVRVSDGYGEVYSEDCVITVVLGKLCEIGTPCLDDSGVTVSMSAITVSKFANLTEYRIDYVLDNLTTDQVIDEGRFTAHFQSGMAMSQSGFFIKLYPGQSTTRTYTWTILKADKDPIYLIEYEGYYFDSTPDTKKLKWFVP